MHRKTGFTLIELLVVVAIIALLIGILLPSLGRARELANRTMCGTRLNGLYKALNTYSVSNRELFPQYSRTGKPDSGQAIKGFQFRARNDDKIMNTDGSPTAAATAIQDSVTAPWWGIVRDGSTSPKNYICPSNKDSDEDRLLTDTNTAAELSKTWDFNLIRVGTEDRATMSYSTFDMYGKYIKNNWGPNTNADWVFAADDNNCNSVTTPTTATPQTKPLHQHRKISQSDPAMISIQEHENSQDHRTEGQNVMFGDGHVSFEQTPFVGPSSNNIYAFGDKTDAFGTAPTMVHTDNTPTHKGDVVLLPVTGNDGENLVEKVSPSGGTTGT